MENVINLGIPHVGEQIFESMDTPGLINCLEVSQTWKVLAENVLIKMWKGKMFEACQNGETKVVQLLLEHCNSEESGLNIKNEYGLTPLMTACFNGHKDIVRLLHPGNYAGKPSGTRCAAFQVRFRTKTGFVLTNAVILEKCQEWSNR